MLMFFLITELLINNFELKITIIEVQEWDTETTEEIMNKSCLYALKHLANIFAPAAIFTFST